MPAQRGEHDMNETLRMVGNEILVANEILTKGSWFYVRNGRNSFFRDCGAFVRRLASDQNIQVIVDYVRAKSRSELVEAGGSMDQCDMSLNIEAGLDV